MTRIIWTNGGQNRSWSAEYFLHSRCQWEPQQLFRPILKQALAFSRIKRPGKKATEEMQKQYKEAVKQKCSCVPRLPGPVDLELCAGASV